MTYSQKGHVACIPQKLTARPQKCDAEVLPLPGADSTVQTSHQLEQKQHVDTQPITPVTPLIGHCASILTWADPVLGPPRHLSWALVRAHRAPALI